MELLCVLAAVLALFLACAALTLKARVPAGMAPLTVLSGIAAVFTLAGMAGVLYPAAWAVHLQLVTKRAGKERDAGCRKSPPGDFFDSLQGGASPALSPPAAPPGPRARRAAP